MHEITMACACCMAVVYTVWYGSTGLQFCILSIVLPERALLIWVLIGKDFLLRSTPEESWCPFVTPLFSLLRAAYAFTHQQPDANCLIVHEVNTKKSVHWQFFRFDVKPQRPRQTPSNTYIA